MMSPKERCIPTAQSAGKRFGLLPSCTSADPGGQVLRADLLRRKASSPKAGNQSRYRYECAGQGSALHRAAQHLAKAMQ